MRNLAAENALRQSNNASFLCSSAKTTFIYGLRDPRNFALRYVGKADKPECRLKKHLTEKGSFHRCQWIAQLKSLGLAPELFIIEEVPKDRWQELERFWIQHYRESGCDLTNTAEGGQGVTGLPLESRRRQAEKYKAHPKFKEHMQRIHQLAAAKCRGRRLPPHLIENLVRISRQRPRTMEERKRMSEAHKGQKLSPEAIAKRTAAVLGSKRSLETKMKMSKAQLGRRHTQQTIEKIRARKLGIPLSAEHRAKLSETMQRVRQTVEYRRRLSEGTKRAWAIRKAKTVDPRQMRMNYDLSLE
jgi:hypothetical protein